MSHNLDYNSIDPPDTRLYTRSHKTSQFGHQGDEDASMIDLQLFG